MKACRVSIVLPCCRAEAYVAGILADIRAQSEKDWELIVVGNGSGQEPQRKIVDSMASQDERVFYCSLEESGVSRARNFGLSRVTGEWVAFVDADDRVPFDWLARMLQLARNDVDMVVGGIAYRDCLTSVERQVDLDVPDSGLVSTEPEDFVPILRSDMAASYSPCSKIYRAAFLKSSDVHFDESLSVYEDGVFCLELALKCGALAFLRQTGYVYCSRGRGSALGQYHDNMPVALSRRRSLLCRVEERGGVGKDDLNRKMATQFVADSLDVLLNACRRGSPYGVAGKVRLVRALFGDPELLSAFRLAVITPSNKPLILFGLFFKIRAAALCALVFGGIFGLRRLLEVRS